MKVFVAPSDGGPCGHFRLIWPAQALRGQLDVTIASKRYTGDLLNADADVVVIQRPTRASLLNEIKGLRARGIAVVVDMDDDLSCVHPRNPSYGISRDLHDNVLDACRAATLVTVTTPALGKRYGTPHVLDNYVLASHLKVAHKDSDLVGWGGDTRTHPGDLEVLGDTVKRLRSDFLVVGPLGSVPRALDLAPDKVRATGHVALGDWPLALARIGIGIAPLHVSPFNDAKSRLKPLQYCAAGVPWVASAAPSYLTLHEEGAGLLAKTQDDWWRHLHRLRCYPAERHELIDAGRAVAAANTIEAHAWRWAEVWTHAVSLERK